MKLNQEEAARDRKVEESGCEWNLILPLPAACPALTAGLSEHQTSQLSRATKWNQQLATLPQFSKLDE